MVGKQDVTMGGPLHSGGDKVLSEKGCIQRNTDQAWPGQLRGLLHEPTCFEIEPNRRMPNGTSGGVRGRFISSYSIDVYRFGGYEFYGASEDENRKREVLDSLKTFYVQLFRKYGIEVDS